MRRHPDERGVTHLIYPELHSKVAICSTFSGGVCFVDVDQKAATLTCFRCIVLAMSFEDMVYLE